MYACMYVHTQQWTHGRIEGVKATVDRRPPYLVERVYSASVEGDIRPVTDFTDEICNVGGGGGW